MRCVKVALGLCGAHRLGRGGVSGHDGEALGPGVHPGPAKDPPDAVWAEAKAAPAIAAQLSGDPIGAESGVGEAEGDHPLLDQPRDLVGHLRPAALSGAQDVQPEALGLAAVAVVGRVVHAQLPAGGAHVAELLSQCQQAQPEAIDHVMISHGGVSLRAVTRRG